MNKKEPLGIIQSRGLGDIIIALPIAKFYYDQGRPIYWPVDRTFIPSLVQSVPWVNWLALDADQGQYFYNTPLGLLTELSIDDTLCLYQSLTGHPDLIARPEAQITKFDQIKYIAAGVPFLNKWRLEECITRDRVKEQSFLDNVINPSGEPYVLVHLEGSDHRAEIDPSWVPQDLKTIQIRPLTDCIFDWLTVIERAEALICTDSVFSNLVDQLGWTDRIDCYFIPRSHIHLTPVLGGDWTWLDPGADVKKRITIFRSGQ